MITREPAYKISDGRTFLTLEAAQSAELVSLIRPENTDPNTEWAFTAAVAEYIAADLVKNKSRVLDILTTGPNSKPKARRINGGSKPRRKAEQIAA